jgi:putative copper resistance protein D
MIALANVNRNRLKPVLAHAASEASLQIQTVRALGRNVFAEASLGIFVLGIVGIIGILPPGLHSEPRWPFPFRLDLGEVATGAQNVLDAAAIGFGLCLAAGVIATRTRRYRVAVVSLVGLVLSGGIAANAMRPGIVPAYPTTFYAPTQPYAASSVARGAPLYTANCAACHGALGRGDGPLARSLPIRPADLTEPHLFAHSAGDIFWWVSYGRGQGVMPGFADKLTQEQRWDLINFVRARAAGIQSDSTGSQVTTSAAPALPDFAFEQGAQNTLSQTLKNGPVLLVLFEPPDPRERLERLAQLGPRFGSSGLRVIAVNLGKSTDKTPFVDDVSDDVRGTLALFRSPKDGGVTELMLDRNGSVRARWTEAGKFADGPTLLADAERVSRIPVAAASHAGHGQ